MNSPDDSLLGKTTVYADRYDPSLLFPIPRAAKRKELGLGTVLPFHGVDVWNAYEFSWLDPRGKPMVAIAEFRVPASSPNIIESKSFKLYLNGFSQERMADTTALIGVLERDLSAAAGAPVTVELSLPAAIVHSIRDLEGECIDDLPVAIDDYGPPKADYLRVTAGEVVEEALVSDLLRSNCPVTGQPDWGSVQVRYRGRPVDREGLLRYLVSFRTHNEFHEQCVERIFVDLMARCAPESLSVYARYTRRGGLDINPFRSNGDHQPANLRGPRQ